MSNASDWYRRHLGGGVQTPPPPGQPPGASPYYTPAPQAYQAPPQAYQPPPGYRLVPEPGNYGQQPPDQTTAYLASLGVGQQGAGHENPWAEPPPPPVDTTRIPRGVVNPTNFLQMANLWRGGQGRQEAQHCPRCDGVLFRRFEGRREAAPLCTSCGWNGLFDQGEHAHTAA
jgi:hypothetical protein